MNKTFTQKWLNLLCAQLSGVESALLMVPDSKHKQLRPLAKWPADQNKIDYFSGVMKYALKKREPVCFPEAIKTEDQDSDLFALPFYLKSRLVGVLLVRTKSTSDTGREAVQELLNKSIQWLRLVSTSSQYNDDNFYASVVALLSACFEKNSYQQSLIAMVTELTLMFNCERVAFSEYKGYYSQVVALSNSADFDTRSNLIQKVADAMDEAIEQDSVILFPNPDARYIQRSHQVLGRIDGFGSILTIPLMHKEQPFAAISLLRNEETPFTEENSRLCQQAFLLLTPYLALKREQEKNLLQKNIQALRQSMQSLTGVHHLKAKLAIIMLVLLVTVGSLVDADYRVTADAILEGRVQRVVSAPFDGYLLSAAARAGDTVRQGDVMASLNDAEINLQLARLQGKLQKARREHREAQSTRNLVKVRIMDEQLKQISAEIELAQQQLDRVNLTAPFDGVVIEGDLAQSLGSPIERGESLFKIAPLDGYRIILKVDEKQISKVHPGQQGQLILPSLSDVELPLSVEKVTIASRAEDGANIFRVEASLNKATDFLRPGMQGVAKINVGRAKLLWIWTHDFIDWARLWFWSWWP